MPIKLKNILPISEARSRIFELAQKAQKPGQIYAFTENGKPKVIMMGAEEYESFMEDFALASDPRFTLKMKKVDREFARKEFVSLRDFEKELGIVRPGSGLVLGEKAKRPYKAGKKKK